MTSNSEIVEGLNDLLEKNYDAEAGYKNALENTDSPRLKTFFRSKADQRYNFGHQIKAEIKKLGGTPNKGTSVTGDLHRAWIDFKTALSFNEDESILEECERGEERCLEEYNEFLKENALSTDLRAVITQQRDGVAAALRSVDALEEMVD